MVMTNTIQYDNNCTSLPSNSSAIHMGKGKMKSYLFLLIWDFYSSNQHISMLNYFLYCTLCSQSCKNV